MVTVYLTPEEAYTVADFAKTELEAIAEIGGEDMPAQELAELAAARSGIKKLMAAWRGSRVRS
jgi:hypothetical protein